MSRHQTVLFIVFTGAAVAIVGMVIWRGTPPAQSPVPASVLGQTSLLDQTHFDTLVIPNNTTIPKASASPTPPATLTPMIERSTITLINGPGELVEGDVATFTWHVGGPTKIIRTTTIYYGTATAPGTLDDYVTPGEAHYTYELNDFLQGEYAIPLHFVGSINQLAPGTYYYRAYAYIDGKHYWSGERTFVIKPRPKHEVKLLHYPSSVSAGGNATFTWEIDGPAATTWFTVIVGGKQSKPGALDASVDIPKTPYAVLVQDFTNGTYNVPLRFIGNANVQDAGVYYFRALAYINGKNIWSDEYSFKVE